MAEPLPAAAPQVAASPPIPVIYPPAFPRPSEVRVLVVDDDEFTLDATTMVLRKCGYDAVGCSSGDERVRAFSALPHAGHSLTGPATAAIAGNCSRSLRRLLQRSPQPTAAAIAAAAIASTSRERPPLTLSGRRRSRRTASNPPQQTLPHHAAAALLAVWLFVPLHMAQSAGATSTPPPALRGLPLSAYRRVDPSSQPPLRASFGASLSRCTSIVVSTPPPTRLSAPASERRALSILRPTTLTTLPKRRALSILRPPSGDGACGGNGGGNGGGFRLLLLDIMMPHTDGVSVLTAIREPARSETRALRPANQKPPFSCRTPARSETGPPSTLHAQVVKS